MKTKIFLAALAAAVLSACTGAPERFTVNGTITDSLATLPGSMVYMLEGNNVIDSSAIAAGKFSFTGDVDKTKTLGVIMRYPGRPRSESRFLATFVPDSKAIAIDLDFPSTVTGSPLTDQINKFEEELMDLYYGKDSEIGSLRLSGKDEQADSLQSAQMEKVSEYCRQAFTEHSQDVIGMQALSMLYQDMDYDELSSLLQGAAPFITENETVVRQLALKKAEKETGAGAPMKEITGTDKEGNPVKLSDFVGKGQYVLIDFWASWCGPCMRALPTLRDLRDKYADKGLRLVGVNVWERTEGAARECVKEKEMDWDIIFTDSNDSAEAYGVAGIPTLILFAPDGTVAGRLLGDEGIEDLVSEFLDK